MISLANDLASSYFIRGLLVALVFGLPAGAIGALTIQRTLAGGFLAGLLSGLGSSAADVLYACVGACGLTVISDFLLLHQGAIHLTGGILMILFGICIFRKQVQAQSNISAAPQLAVCFGSAFAIAIANPATILSFMLAFAAFGIAEQLTAVQCCELIMGIFIGTALWWAVLAGVVSLFRKRITDHIYKVMNRILGCVLTIFGLIVLIGSCR